MSNYAVVLFNIASLFYLELSAADFCGESYRICMNHDDIDVDEHRMSINCVGNNYTINYDLISEVEYLYIGIFCEPSCSEPTTEKLDPYRISDSLTGSIDIVNVTECTVVGCYQKNLHGAGFGFYSFNAGSCILNDILDMDGLSTTIDITPDFNMEIDEFNMTSVENDTLERYEFNNVTALTGQNRQNIIIPLVIFAVSSMAILSSIIICSIKIRKFQEEHSTKYSCENSMLTDEIDLHFQPVKVELSMNIAAESLPSLYHALYQLSLSDIETDLSESQKEDSGNYYKPVDKESISTSSNSSIFNFDMGEDDDIFPEDATSELRTPEYTSDKEESQLSENYKPGGLIRTSLSKSPSHDSNSITFSFDMTLYDTSPEDAITKVSEVGIPGNPSTKVDQLIGDYYKPDCQTRTSLSKFPLHDFDSITFNFDVCNKDATMKVGIPENTLEKEECQLVSGYCEPVCQERTSLSESPFLQDYNSIAFNYNKYECNDGSLESSTSELTPELTYERELVSDYYESDGQIRIPISKSHDFKGISFNFDMYDNSPEDATISRTPENTSESQLVGDYHKYDDQIRTSPPKYSSTNESYDYKSDHLILTSTLKNHSCNNFNFDSVGSSNEVSPLPILDTVQEINASVNSNSNQSYDMKVNQIARNRDGYVVHATENSTLSTSNFKADLNFCRRELDSLNYNIDDYTTEDAAHLSSLSLNSPIPLLTPGNTDRFSCTCSGYVSEYYDSNKTSFSLSS